MPPLALVWPIVADRCFLLCQTGGFLFATRKVLSGQMRNSRQTTQLASEGNHLERCSHFYFLYNIGLKPLCSSLSSLPLLLSSPLNSSPSNPASFSHSLFLLSPDKSSSCEERNECHSRSTQQIVLKNQRGQILTAKYVIITVPLTILKEGDITFTPRLPSNELQLTQFRCEER